MDNIIKQCAQKVNKMFIGHYGQTWNKVMGGILQTRSKPWEDAATLRRDRKAWQ